MKRVLILTAALAVAVAGLAAGCGSKKPRVLPEDFTYEFSVEEHWVNYTDSEDRRISLYGQIYEPQGEGKFPAVILSHGFNGHFSDFPQECARFAERGYICYAFDFCGAQSGGRSKGRTAEAYTPFTMKEDLGAVVKNIGKQKKVDGSQIFLFGGSQGGFVTALTAADNEIGKRVAAVALYFPAFNIPDDWRNQPAQDTPLMGYSIGAKYIESVHDLDPFEVIGGYRGDVCIVWGDQDALVKRQYIDSAVEAYGKERVDLTVIPGAGHGFGGEALKTATEKVLSFLEAHTFA